MSRGKTRTRRLYEGHEDKLRFLVVGIFNTAAGYALFLILLALLETALGTLSNAGTAVPEVIADNYFLLAQWVSWVISVPIGATTLKYFVFRSKGSLRREIFRAYFVYLPGLAISSGVLWFAVRLMHLPPAVGQLLAIAAATVFSYMGHKHFTFREQPATQPLTRNPDETPPKADARRSASSGSSHHDSS